MVDQTNTDEQKSAERPPGFLEVRDHEGHLLFLFDPERKLISIKPRGRPLVLIDLRMFEPRTTAPARAPHGRMI